MLLLLLFAAVFVVWTGPLAGAYSILGVFPSRDRANFLAYGTLFRELAARGHDVTLIGNFPLPAAPASYKEILLTSPPPPPRALSFDSVVSPALLRVPFETLVAARAGHDECRALVENSEVLSLVRRRSSFDVVVVESVNSDCGFALAHNLSAPYVGFVPGTLRPWQYARLGIPFHPAHAPLWSVAHGRERGWLERAASAVLYRADVWTHHVCSQVADRVLLYPVLGERLPALETLAAAAAPALLLTHPALWGGLAGAALVPVGGLHLRTPRALPTEIERFITEAEHGVVYFSLGSTALESSLPPERLAQLVEFFSELRQRVLWKWDLPNEQQRGLARNVLVRKWMPQYDILKHRNVVAFISQCGVLSATEAVAAGVPLVCVPLFSDQHGTAAALRDAGVAALLHYEDLDKASLHEALNLVLEPSVQQQARNVSRVWHDRPLSALETAVYWVEYVARHRGAPHLRAPGPRDPALVRLQLDLIALFSLLAGAVLFVSYKALRLVCCCCCSSEEALESAPTRSRNDKRVKFE